MIPELKKSGEILKKYLDKVDDQNSKIIIILDNDPEYINGLKKYTKHNQNLILISDTDEFRAFIHENGCNKMYVDLNMGRKNGLDLAEEMKLNECFGELIFASGWVPTEEQLNRIEALGSKFVSKSELLDTIIYPRGA